jgi:tripartite-type tricarboxylate transporter receptor subunit TctC
VATTAGSQPDMIARLITQKLAEQWGKPVVVDNRPSGGGTIAAATVAKATADGHTLLYVLPNFVISAATQPVLPYDARRDFTAVTQIGLSTNVLTVASTLGVKTVQDFVALARAQPGKMIFGSGATGTAGHITGARFNLVAGIKVLHVAFKGGPDAAIEILAGRSHYTIATMGVALPFVKDGKLVGLAVTTPQRTPVLPDVPALGEIYAEFKRPETSHGIVAPAATPRAVVQQLNRDFRRALDLPDVKARLQSIAFTTLPTTPQDYDQLLAAQFESLARLAADIGLRPK